MPRLHLPRSESLFNSEWACNRRQLCSSVFDQFSPKIHPRISAVSASSCKRLCTAKRMSPPTPLDPYPCTNFRKDCFSRRAREISPFSRCNASWTEGLSDFRLTVLMSKLRFQREQYVSPDYSDLCQSESVLGGFIDDKKGPRPSGNP